MINNLIKPMSNVCNVFQLQFEVCCFLFPVFCTGVYGLYRNTIMRLIPMKYEGTITHLQYILTSTALNCTDHHQAQVDPVIQWSVFSFQVSVYTRTFLVSESNSWSLSSSLPSLPSLPSHLSHIYALCNFFLGFILSYKHNHRKRKIINLNKLCSSSFVGGVLFSVVVDQIFPWCSLQVSSLHQLWTKKTNIIFWAPGRIEDT